MLHPKEQYKDEIVDLALTHNDLDRRNKIFDSVERLAGLLILNDAERHQESANYDSIIQHDPYGQLMLFIGSYMTATDAQIKQEYSRLIIERLVLNANKYFLQYILDSVAEKREEILETKYEDEAYDFWAEARDIRSYQQERNASQVFGSEREIISL